MGTIKRSGWWLGLLIAFGLLAITGSVQLQQFVGAHGGPTFRTLLLILVAIPVSIVTLAATEPTAPKPNALGALLPLFVIYFLYRTFIRVNQYLCHSNLTTDYGWIGRWLLVSPRMHRLHHAKAVEYHDKNFTFDLVVWDRIFGTYAACDAAEIRAIPLGLDDNPFNGTGTIKSVLRDYFLTSYILLWQALRNGVRLGCRRGLIVHRAQRRCIAIFESMPWDLPRSSTDGRVVAYNSLMAMPFRGIASRGTGWRGGRAV